MRTKTRLLTTAIAFYLFGCSAIDPDRQLLNQIATAMGGEARILAVETLVLQGSGQQFRLGQNVTPDRELPQYRVREYRQAIDFANRRWRDQIVRIPEFPTANPGPVTRISGVDNGVAFDVGSDGTASRLSDLEGEARRMALYHHPVGIVQAALDPAARVVRRRESGDEEAIDIMTSDGTELTLYADMGTKLPARVRSSAYNRNLGDVFVETVFEDYEEVDQIMLPTRLTTRLDRFTTAIFEVNSSVNADTGKLEAPVGIKSAPAPVRMASVEVEQVARGIWYLTGGSHHSVVIEFDDHLTLIEAPQGDVRTLAVIEQARQLNPDKPLTEVINTHHHFDHSGGIRAAIASGLTVITHEGNRRFVEDIASRSHTAAPDALDQKPRPLRIETVAEKHTISDRVRTIELYPVRGSAHSETMLMVYFPAQRILTFADVYTPPAEGEPIQGSFPFVTNLMENIETYSLRIDRVMPIHGRVVPFSEVRMAADREAGRDEEEMR